MDFADHNRQRPKLNIAPLIDVVFLLLIFFMLAGSFVERTAIDLSIPSNQTPTSATGEPLVVDVGPSGRLALNGLALTLDQLGPELIARAAGDVDCAVTIRAKASVPVQDLVSVMDRVRGTGFKKIRLATPNGH